MLSLQAQHGRMSVHFWYATKTVDTAKTTIVEAISKPQKGAPRYLFPLTYQELKYHPIVSKFIADEKIDLESKPATGGLPICLSAGEIVNYVDLETERFQFKGVHLLPHPKNRSLDQYRLCENPADFIATFKRKHSKTPLVDRLDKLVELLPDEDKVEFELKALDLNFEQMCEHFVAFYESRHFKHGQALQSEKSNSLYTLCNNQLTFFSSYGTLDFPKIYPLLKFALNDDQWSFICKWIPNPDVKGAEEQLLKAAKRYDDLKAKCADQRENLVGDSNASNLFRGWNSTLFHSEVFEEMSSLNTSPGRTAMEENPTDSPPTGANSEQISEQDESRENFDQEYQTPSDQTSASSPPIPTSTPLNFPPNFSDFRPVIVPPPTRTMESFVRNLAFNLAGCTGLPTINYLEAFGLRGYSPDGQALSSALNTDTQIVASGPEYINMLTTGQVPSSNNVSSVPQILPANSTAASQSIATNPPNGVNESNEESRATEVNAPIGRDDATETIAVATTIAATTMNAPIDANTPIRSNALNGTNTSKGANPSNRTNPSHRTNSSNVANAQNASNQAPKAAKSNASSVSAKSNAATKTKSSAPRSSTPNITDDAKRSRMSSDMSIASQASTINKFNERTRSMRSHTSSKK